MCPDNERDGQNSGSSEKVNKRDVVGIMIRIVDD